MGIQISGEEIIIDIPELKQKMIIKRSQIEKIEEVVPPDEVCNLIIKLRELGVIVAGSTLDGRISYYNITPGKTCLLIKLKDGRSIYVSKD